MHDRQDHESQDRGRSIDFGISIFTQCDRVCYKTQPVYTVVVETEHEITSTYAPAWGPPAQADLDWQVSDMKCISHMHKSFPEPSSRAQRFRNMSHTLTRYWFDSLYVGSLTTC